MSDDSMRHEAVSDDGLVSRSDEPRLTPREKQCLDLLSEGLSAGEIAYRLGLKKVTVDLHVRNAKKKLHSKTREQAVAMAVRQAEEKYRKVFDSASDGMLIFDSSGRILDANAATCRLYGVAADNLIAANIDSVVSAAKDPGWRRVLDEEEQSAPVDSTERRSDGSRFDAEVTWTAFRHAGNLNCLAVVRDVSQRRLAERALRDSDERLRAVFDSAGDLISLKDVNFRFTHVNRALAEFHGLSIEDVLGKTDADFFPPDELTEIRLADRAVLAGGRIRVEYPLTVRGKSKFLEVVKMPVHNAEGAVVGICAVGRDITERKRAEHAQRVSAENLRLVLDNYPDAANMKDRDGRLIYCNRHYAHRHGRSQPDLVGLTVYDLYPREAADEIRKQERSVVETGQPQTFQVFRTFHGTDRRLIVLRFPITAETEEVVGIGSISIDITDRAGDFFDDENPGGSGGFPYWLG